jgi:hypothetical protein
MTKTSSSEREIIKNDLFPFIRDGNKPFLCRYGFLRFPGTAEQMQSFVEDFTFSEDMAVYAFHALRMLSFVKDFMFLLMYR